MEPIKTKIKGDRRVTMAISGVEARALEAAAEMLADGGERRQRRHKIASHLHRLNARWRLQDRVS